MRTVLMSGAQNYEGLLRDFIAWRESGRAMPDLVLVPHGFTEEALEKVGDPKRLTVDKQGRVFVNAIPLLCLCQLMGEAPDLLDCPAVTGGDQLPSFEPRNDDDLDMHTDEPPAPKVAKKVAKAAKATKSITKKKH